MTVLQMGSTSMTMTFPMAFFIQGEDDTIRKGAEGGSKVPKGNNEWVGMEKQKRKRRGKQVLPLFIAAEHQIIQGIDLGKKFSFDDRGLN